MKSDNRTKLLGGMRHSLRFGYGLFTAMFLIIALNSSAIGGDLKKGEKSFIKCKACHTVEKDVSKIGPSLYGVFGRTSGTLESFPNYSDAMKSAAIVWEDETIRAFLKAPRTYIANTKMFFIGMRSDSELDNLLAYLKSVTGAETASKDADTQTASNNSGDDSAVK